MNINTYTNTDTNNELNTFKPYTVGAEYKVPAGTRMVKILFQGEAKVNNSYCLIKDNIRGKQVEENLGELTPYIIEWLQGIQAQIARGEHKAGLLRVYPDKLEMAGILSHLATSGSGVAFNKESIKEWFEEFLKEGISQLVAGKLGLDLEALLVADDLAVNDAIKLQRLETVVDTYCNKYISLSSGRAKLPEKEREQLTGLLDKFPESKESPVGLRIVARLNAMQEAKEELIDLL